MQEHFCSPLSLVFIDVGSLIQQALSHLFWGYWPSVHQVMRDHKTGSLLTLTSQGYVFHLLCRQSCKVSAVLFVCLIPASLFGGCSCLWLGAAWVWLLLLYSTVLLTCHNVRSVIRSFIWMMSWGMGQIWGHLTKWCNMLCFHRALLWLRVCSEYVFKSKNKFPYSSECTARRHSSGCLAEANTDIGVWGIWVSCVWIALIKISH